MYQPGRWGPGAGTSDGSVLSRPAGVDAFKLGGVCTLRLTGIPAQRRQAHIQFWGDCWVGDRECAREDEGERTRTGYGGSHVRERTIISDMVTLA